MLGFYRDKHYRSPTVWLMVAVFLAVRCEHANGVAKSPPPQQSVVRVTGETLEAALAINSVCGKILRDDFKSAQEIVRKSAALGSNGLRQLGTIIDEYMAIKARRKASQNDAYQGQIDELEKLRRKGLSEDINDISEVFASALKALEYADEPQKQALLKNPLTSQTVQQAKTRAAEFESKGKWLDAYRICYSKLGQIYKDNKAYSDYAEQLLEKADILASLQDSPCETCEERYLGIEKQMFINAVDFLDSSYVNIVDYRGMTTKAVNRCKLLAEVMSNSYLETSYKIRNTQYEVWSAALAAILNEVNQSPADINKDKLIDVFEQVLALNESPRAGIELPQALLVAQFAKGALSALDPYTVIYWPSRVQDFEKAITNQFTGIGIKFSKEEEVTKVVGVLPNTPAYHAGLETGDVIQAVDGVETRIMSHKCLVKSITGQEDTEVTLTIKRRGENKTRDITVNRANIIIPSIRGWQKTETGKWLYMIDGRNKIGYIRIGCFNSRTAGDFEEALAQLEAKELKGLILDLRSNPGGLLNSAVEIADKFIEEGLIVRVQPRFGIATYAMAHREKTHPNYPVVVLTNRFTASAPEILVGVLQEPKYARATLVGERTYGKGSVQSIVSCPGNGAKLKYTAAYYHLPSGQRVKSRGAIREQGREDWGILPNVEVKLRSDELRKMADVQKANESLVKVGNNSTLSGIERYSSQETIDVDPQLAIGLLVLKSKMIQSGYRLALN